MSLMRNSAALPLLLAGCLGIAFVASVLRAMSSTRRAAWPANGDPFSQPEVVAAPPASLSLNKTQSFSDARGAYTRVVFPGSTPSKLLYTNVIHSRAGALRGGDLHKCDQVNFMVLGKAGIVTLENGVRVTSTLSAGETKRIPAGIPHLFRFQEDSIMTEHWVNTDGSLCAFKSWYYKPFRDEIDASLKKAA